MGKMNTEHDFLSNLFTENPEAFEEYKNELLEEYFNSLPEEKRLQARQQQWLLEADLRKYKDPTARLNRMIELFWKSALELNEALKMFGGKR